MPTRMLPRLPVIAPSSMVALAARRRDRHDPVALYRRPGRELDRDRDLLTHCAVPRTVLSRRLELGLVSVICGSRCPIRIQLHTMSSWAAGAGGSHRALLTSSD